MAPNAEQRCRPNLLQILVTELGDETFIIAAIMAMRHPRLVVYAGAMSALGLMTVRARYWLPDNPLTPAPLLA